MGDQPTSTQSAAPHFCFFKGGEDVIAEKSQTTFDWRQNKPNKESSGNIRCQAVKVAVWLADDQPASEGIVHNCGD